MLIFWQQLLWEGGRCLQAALGTRTAGVSGEKTLLCGRVSPRGGPLGARHSDSVHAPSNRETGRPGSGGRAWAARALGGGWLTGPGGLGSLRGPLGQCLRQRELSSKG